MTLADIVIIGEAWGEIEERRREPFVGPSGKVLNWLLHQAGIARRECFLTNVFNLRPRPTNNILNLCGPKIGGIEPPLNKGKYIRQEYRGELDRLHQELRNESPNLILALGGTAAWAVLGTSGIRNVRGYIAPSKFGKVLPTYHPSAVMRQWELHAQVILDLQKAKREAEFPEIRRPQRRIYLEPSLSDMEDFYREYLRPARRVGCDVETVGDRVTCIGFGVREAAIVIPFLDPRNEDNNYFLDPETESLAWEWVHSVAWEKPLVFQNGMYDMSFLWKNHGIPVPSAEDTMLASHAQQPEMEKSLNFLGSIHTSELSWKHMRKSLTNKKDDL